MDSGRQPARGRARSRTRARGESSSPTAGAGPGDEASVYPVMYAPSEGSTSSNGKNGSGGNGQGNGNGSGNGNGNGNGNGSNGGGSSRGSRGGSPRGMPTPAQFRSFPVGKESDYIFTRPNATFEKKVEPSANTSVVPVVTNYYALRTRPNWSPSLYTVRCEPAVDEAWKIKKLVASQRETIGSYILTGNQLFTTRKIPEENTTFQGTFEDRRDGQTSTYQVYLDLLREVEEGESVLIQFYNLIVRQMQNLLHYDQLGRHFFDHQQKVDFTQWRLSLWPGFQNSIRTQESGLMINVESVWKVLQTDTVLTLMTNIRRQNPEQANFQRACKEAIEGMVVVTIYNRKAYKIDRVDFDTNPQSTFPKSDGSNITYVNYYRERYDKNIGDVRQPMLVCEPRERDRRRGQTGDILLVPELCHPCGLNDTLRSNFKLMKDLASCLHTPPTERVRTMNKFIQGALANVPIVETLRDWGLKFPVPHPVETKARMITPEEIIMANGAKIRPDDKADWTMGLRGKQMVSSMMLKNWAIVVTNRDHANIGQLVTTMQRVATPLGYRIEQPFILRVNEPRGYPQGIDDVMAHFKGKIDMIMVILMNNNADTYAAVKKRCSIEFGVPSQCFLAKNVGSKGLMSIATKVVIQMNAKQGGEPWGVANQLKGKNLMVLGYDVHHAGVGVKGASSIGAMTATTTPSLGTYYSCVKPTPTSRTEVATVVAGMFERCLKAYHQKNGTYPDNIMMYRDGVGEGQLPDVATLEIQAFKDKINTLYSEKGQAIPKLAFIVVNKRISTRFFQRVGQEKYDNPKPGMICDDVVTRPERYDFYLISQTARQGCVSPTYYNVLLEEINLSPDKLQRFTFKLCHMYYNWSGTVAVPAPCQNAHKLAFLVGTALKRPANATLSHLLHFL